MSTDPRFALAIARFDEINAADPNRELDDGVERPKELLYAQRMTRWLERLAPDASELLRLAARCQHIARWEIPRDRYPMDRRGYHRWRTALAQLHADRAAEVLREVGYGDDVIARVQALVRKERLKFDPEVQLLEDVVCLVFLESYFADFARRHDDEKVITILRKTWAKMSPAGRQAALGLDLPADARRLVERAIASPDA